MALICQANWHFNAPSSPRRVTRRLTCHANPVVLCVNVTLMHSSVNMLQTYFNRRTLSKPHAQSAKLHSYCLYQFKILRLFETSFNIYFRYRCSTFLGHFRSFPLFVTTQPVSYSILHSGMRNQTEFLTITSLYSVRLKNL